LGKNLAQRVLTLFRDFCRFHEVCSTPNQF
jgi:hypothetical protein